jgi:hypothetical protein
MKRIIAVLMLVAAIATGCADKGGTSPTAPIYAHCV